MVRPLGSGRPNSACQRRRSAAPDNDRTRSISASTAAASTNRCSMSGRPRLDHAIDPLAIRLLGLQGQPELLAHHPGLKAAHRMGLPAGRRDDGRNGGALRPVQQRRAVQAIFQRYNEVSTMLAEQPHDYCPIFMIHTDEIVLAPWAAG